ncbi:MAG: SH3 domain-containing protein [Anaerolineaceae bacterium]|nr:SH3 domain-containing protein [Anaerolineaceae bacterium]MCY4023684.1 SH3 domain-containing protein [Anaerolineaceae bacterium]
MRQLLFAGLLLAVSALVLPGLLLPGLSLAQGDVWRGIPVAPENRCSPYDRDDYPYSQSVELQIIAREGGQICSPYTNECFESRFDTDIEHIIAVSEAHDSGLCAASAATRAQFASDLRNLTLASPALNRNQKRAKDAAEWLPALNRCWFANQIISVRRAYSLTIDRREADALERVLANCDLDLPLDPGATPVHVVSAARVNARACADTSCEIVTTFSSGHALDVIEEVEGAAWNDDTRWLKVSHEDGEVYVHASLVRLVTPTPVPTATPVPTSTPRPAVSVNPNQATTPWYVVAPAQANARTCPRTTCSIVTSFARGAEVNVLQAVSGETVGGASTWQAVKQGSQVVYVHGPLLSRSRPAPTSVPARQAGSGQGQASVQPTAVTGPQFTCNCSKSCSAMVSCQEAYFQLNTCGCSRRDRDRDGVPCESICPGG